MRARAHGAAAVGLADAAVGVRAGPRHGLSGQRGLAAEFSGALAGRHRDRCDEFLPRADGVVHGGGVLRDPVDGIGGGYFACRRPSRSGDFNCSCRHDHGIPLCVRLSRSIARLRVAVHGPDGRKAAGRPGHAGGDGGVGGTFRAVGPPVFIVSAYSDRKTGIHPRIKSEGMLLRNTRVSRPISTAFEFNRTFMSKDVKKVVLAYSGGLDTSIILKWLQTTYG